MDKKMRLILFGLAILLVISVFISFRLYNGKQILQQEFSEEKQKWQKENEQLVEKLSSSEREKTRLKDRMETIQRDLDAIAAERNDLKQKFEVVTKEKEELLERLQTRPKEVVREIVRKEPVPVGDEYWALILKEKTALEIELKDLNEILKQSRLELAKLSDEKQALGLERNNLEKEKQDLERKLEYNQKLIDALSTDLVREKIDKNNLIVQLRDLKNDNTGLRSKLKTKEKANLFLARKLTKVETEKSALAEKISSMNLALQSKLDEIIDIKEKFEDIKQDQERAAVKSVELPPIVVKGTSRISPVPAQILKQGKIIAVNQENNFVVIDLGKVDGVRPGHKFRVTRGQKQIAIVEVIQIRKSICAADIAQIETKKKIRVGDLVK